MSPKVQNKIIVSRYFSNKNDGISGEFYGFSKQEIKFAKNKTNEIEENIKTIFRTPEKGFSPNEQHDSVLEEDKIVNKCNAIVYDMLKKIDKRILKNHSSPLEEKYKKSYQKSNNKSKGKKRTSQKQKIKIEKADKEDSNGNIVKVVAEKQLEVSENSYNNDQKKRRQRVSKKQKIKIENADKDNSNIDVVKKELLEVSESNNDQKKSRKRASKKQTIKIENVNKEDSNGNIVEKEFPEQNKTQKSIKKQDRIKWENSETTDIKVKIKKEENEPERKLYPFLDVKKELFVPVWVPPKSPHNLIEEDLYFDPWALLVATIFLNKTSCKSARPYVFWFLEENPDPMEVLRKKSEDFEKYFDKLGLQKTRSIQVWRMSHDYLYKRWKRVKELYGVGQYGEDAFRMFCLGDFSVNPNDRFLKIYKAWYQLKENEDRLKEMNN